MNSRTRVRPESRKMNGRGTDPSRSEFTTEEVRWVHGRVYKGKRHRHRRELFLIRNWTKLKGRSWRVTYCNTRYAQKTVRKGGVIFDMVQSQKRHRWLYRDGGPDHGPCHYLQMTHKHLFVHLVVSTSSSSVLVTWTSEHTEFPKT